MDCAPAGPRVEAVCEANGSPRPCRGANWHVTRCGIGGTDCPENNPSIFQMSLTRFSVPPLHKVTRSLAAVAMGREAPDLVITGARILSTYTERTHEDREVWIKSGRIAAVKPAGSC